MYCFLHSGVMCVARWSENFMFGLCLPPRCDHKELRWLSAFANEPSIGLIRVSIKSRLLCIFCFATLHSLNVHENSFNWFVGSRMICFNLTQRPSLAHTWNEGQCCANTFTISETSVTRWLLQISVNWFNKSKSWLFIARCRLPIEAYLIDKSPCGS